MAKKQLQLRQAHKQDENELNPKAHFHTPDVDFIPFVCHYDPKTILTKNGELLQVIRITGFNHESISSELVNLRETVRDSIVKHVKTSDFALWLHTIRRRKDIFPAGEFPDFFSEKVNEIWNEEHDWKNQFVNELYLTVIIQGYDTSIQNGVSLIRSFSSKATKNLHKKELALAHGVLSEMTKNILEDLEDYGAKIIGINSWQDTLYSEPLRFFGKIVNLSEDRYPLDVSDISHELGKCGIAFGNRSLEVSDEKKKHFAAMFSIKEYREVSVASLDQLLQIPQEFIITQSLDFIDRNQALAAFEYQNYILDISHDEQLKYLSGLETIIESDQGLSNDYAKQQITIMLINQTVQGLESDISSALEKLHSLGLVTVREDIFSEHCFWSQLPGNFKFLRRQNPINSSRAAGFASLHNFPAGSRSGNYWGDAVTIFRTILGTPYFFNFHDGDNGHTMIVGPFGTGKTVLMNFLVCQSRKFKNKLFYFGYNRSGNIFIKAMNGNYFSITNKTGDRGALKLNPFNLANTPENKKFITDWIRYLVTYGKDPVPAEEINLIPEIVEKITSENVKKLSNAVQFFKSEATKTIYEKLSIWHSSGKFAFIFDHEEENIWSDNLINAFNLTAVLEHKSVTLPIISYILHRIETVLDGSPSMIVLDEAWKYLDNYGLGPNINDWLVRLRKKNCVVIFATESVKNAAESSITEAIHHNVATHIFLPDESPADYYTTIFGLNESELQLLSAMSVGARHFLLKHAEDAVIASLDLGNVIEIVNVLSSKPETLKLMEDVILEVGEDPKDWLPKFFQIINGEEEELEEEGVEEKKIIDSASIGKNNKTVHDLLKAHKKDILPENS